MAASSASDEPKYWRHEHPLAKWVYKQLEPVKQELTNTDLWYPERFKPRQPNELEKLSKSLEKIFKIQETLLGVLAIKRDGWFLEIRITPSDKVHYLTFEGQEYNLDGLINLKTLRDNLPPELKNEEIIIHGEVFVMKDGEQKEAGCDVVRRALSRWNNKAAPDIRKWVRFSAFRLHTIGYIKGASFEHMLGELVILHALLKGQANNVSIIDHFVFRINPNQTINSVGYAKALTQESMGCTAEFMTSVNNQLVLNKKDNKGIVDPCELKSIALDDFVKSSISFADQNSLEGFILSVDPPTLIEANKELTFRDCFKKDVFHTYRSQFQIKCKSLFEGTFKIDPETRTITDKTGRKCGVIEVGETFYEKGFFQAMKPTDSVKIRCAWISCKENLFSGEKNYKMTGIKYLRKNDVVHDPDNLFCMNVETICTKSSRWVSVHSMQDTFLEENNLKVLKTKRPKYVQAWIEKVLQRPLPTKMYHINYPKSQNLYTSKSDWLETSKHIPGGVVISLPPVYASEKLKVTPKHAAVDVVLEFKPKDNAYVMGAKLHSTEHNQRNLNCLADLFDSSKFTSCLRLAHNEEVNRLLCSIPVAMVARVCIPDHRLRNLKDDRDFLIKTLQKTKSSHDQSVVDNIKLYPYRLLKFGQISGLDVDATAQLEIMLRLLKDQTFLRAPSFVDFKKDTNGFTSKHRVDFWTKQISTTEDIIKYCMFESEQRKRDFVLRLDPPQDSITFQELVDEEATDDENEETGETYSERTRIRKKQLLKNNETEVHLEFSTIQSKEEDSSQHAYTGNGHLVQSDTDNTARPTPNASDKDTARDSACKQIEGMSYTELRKLLRIKPNPQAQHIHRTSPVHAQEPPRGFTALLHKHQPAETRYDPNPIQHSPNPIQPSPDPETQTAGKTQSTTPLVQRKADNADATTPRDQTPERVHDEVSQQPSTSRGRTDSVTPMADQSPHRKRSYPTMSYPDRELTPTPPVLHGKRYQRSDSTHKTTPPQASVHTTTQPLADPHKKTQPHATISRGTHSPAPNLQFSPLFLPNTEDIVPDSEDESNVDKPNVDERNAKRSLPFTDENETETLELSVRDLTEKFVTLIKNYSNDPNVEEIKTITRNLTASQTQFESFAFEFSDTERVQAMLLFTVCKLQPELDLSQPQRWSADNLQDFMEKFPWYFYPKQDVKSKVKGITFEDNLKNPMNDLIQNFIVWVPEHYEKHSLERNGFMDLEGVKSIYEKVWDLHIQDREECTDILAGGRDADSDVQNVFHCIISDIQIFMAIKGCLRTYDSDMLLDSNSDYYHACCSLIHKRITWLEKAFNSRLLIEE